jgi:DNA polymerase
MPGINIKNLEKYLQSRKDVGDDGFWISPGEKKEVKKKSEQKIMTKTIKNKSDQMIDDLEKIKKKVLKCKKCPLGEYRLNPCFGNGNPSTKIMFIGEGPGFDEDHKGDVFIGRAGKLLDSLIKEHLNLDRTKFFITNIVKCHPMKDPSDPEKRGNDRAPSESETSVCEKLYLIPQIQLIKPNVIVTLGSPSSKTILKTNDGITSIRGKIFDMEFDGFKSKVVPVFHPAYLLRNPPKKTEFIEDLKVIKSLL